MPGTLGWGEYREPQHPLSARAGLLTVGLRCAHPNLPNLQTVAYLVVPEKVASIAVNGETSGQVFDRYYQPSQRVPAHMTYTVWSAARGRKNLLAWPDLNHLDLDFETLRVSGHYSIQGGN